MERPINTILNELRRSSVDQIKQGKLVKIYYADAGQAQYDKNRKNCGRKYSLMECSDFISYVKIQMLDGDWSVDAAVGRATAKSSIVKKLSTKTIYNYIDLGLLKVRNIDLPLKLKRNNKPKRVRQNRRVLGDSIDQRPKHIEDRQEFGHWEIDTVIGKKAKNDEVLLTLVERMTRNVISWKIQGKTAEDVMSEVEKLKGASGNKFSHVFKTITADNRSEFATLSNLNESGVGVYFTHPYSFFERGSNEKHNSLIRRFIPKGKRISRYSQDAVSRIEDWCNGLPRKILGYKTPEKLFESQLDQIYAL